MGTAPSAKVLLLRFPWVPVNSWLLRPGPHLLLYWNQFVQHGNFVTFLTEGNFLFQLYHCKVFFPGGRANHMCLSLFFLFLQASASWNCSFTTKSKDIIHRNKPELSPRSFFIGEPRGSEAGWNRPRHSVLPQQSCSHLQRT